MQTDQAKIKTWQRKTIKIKLHRQKKEGNKIGQLLYTRLDYKKFIQQKKVAGHVFLDVLNNNQPTNRSI